jgi:hypothetical protein
LDEGCSELLYERKQAKLQWLQYPSEINVDNLNNIRRETSRHFRNKKREYLKDKIDELATNNEKRTPESCIEKEMNLRVLSTEHLLPSSPLTPHNRKGGHCICPRFSRSRFSPQMDRGVQA